MALRDSACYTLLIHPTKDPAIAEIIEEGQSGRSEPEARYARVKEKKDGEEYSASLYDAFSGARLASAGFAAEKHKKRRLDLHGPDEEISFESTGKLSFEWTFIFEGNKYRWTHELYGRDWTCALDRKPDPRVEICLAREADRSSPAKLQILHYNIERFPTEIKDVRGLEALLLMSLLCLTDAAEVRASSGARTPEHAVEAGAVKDAPPPPPKQVIDEDDYEPDPNEIIVGPNSDVDQKVARAIGLLEDPHMLFLIIRTRNVAAAQKALEVSLGVTRFRHREGLKALHQYVLEEDPTPPSKKAEPPRSPTRINLNDPHPAPPKKPSPKPSGSDNIKEWKPPQNIAIYLSNIELPALIPARRQKDAEKAAEAKMTMPSAPPAHVAHHPKPVTLAAPRPKPHGPSPAPFRTSPTHSRPVSPSKPSVPAAAQSQAKPKPRDSLRSDLFKLLGR